MRRWSNSMLYTAQQCGERFRRKYIERDFRPSSIRAKRGIAVHKVAGKSHVRQLAGKERGDPREVYIDAVLSDEEAKDVAATEFDHSVKEYGVAWSDAEKEIGVEKVAGEEKDTAVRMAGYYVGKVARGVDPLAVERSLTIKPAGLDVEILGIIDLVGEEPAPALDPFAEEPERRVRGVTIEVVHDLKTSDKRPREDAIGSNQQLTMYSLLRAAQTGKPPDRVRLTTLVNSRQGVVTVTQTGTRSLEDLNAVAARIDASIRMVEAGAFVPANPDAWWCSEKFCEYWTECKFALGRKR
jgi:hypothetical protein